MTPIVLWIPGLPPSVNHKSGLSRGRVFNTQETVIYQKLVRAIAWRERAQLKIDHWVIVEGVAVFPNRARRDLDNLWKVPLDSLVRAGVLQDDRKVLTRWMRVGLNPQHPGLQLTILACPPGLIASAL